MHTLVFKHRQQQQFGFSTFGIYVARCASALNCLLTLGLDMSR
jgi:hypothetical protein